MALAGIELKYLVGRISGETSGYYTSNIYGIDRDSILFKLHHPEKPDILLVLSTAGVWITSVRVQQVEPNRMVRRLRDTLRRFRLEDITQPGLDRLAYLKFGGFGKHFVLIGEFFGDGNIILCDASGKVLALQHSINVRHRSLAVGAQYEPPPSAGRDAAAMETSEYMGVLDVKMACARWLGRTLGLPRRYAEGIPHMAGVDPRAAGNTLTESQARALREAAVSTIRDVTDGNHSPAILRGPPPEASPLHLGRDDAEPVGDFMEALDRILTEKILERGRREVSGESQDKAAKLKNMLSEQKKAVGLVRRRAEALSNVAASMPEMLSLGILRLDSAGAAGHTGAERRHAVPGEGRPGFARAGREGPREPGRAVTIHGVRTVRRLQEAGRRRAGHPGDDIKDAKEDVQGRQQRRIPAGGGGGTRGAQAQLV